MESAVGRDGGGLLQAATVPFEQPHFMQTRQRFWLCLVQVAARQRCLSVVAAWTQWQSPHKKFLRAVSFILHTAAFVGIVEEYNASVCLWHERFGGSIVSSEEVAIQLSSSLHPPYDTSPASMGGFVDRADEQTYNAGVLRFHLELSKTHKCGQVAQRRSLRSLAL